MHVYPESMEPDTSVDQQDDLFWDEHQQRWLSRAGVARWKTVLAERSAFRAEHAGELAAFREQLRSGSAGQA